MSIIFMQYNKECLKSVSSQAAQIQSLKILIKYLFLFEEKKKREKYGFKQLVEITLEVLVCIAVLTTMISNLIWKTKYVFFYGGSCKIKKDIVPHKFFCHQKNHLEEFGSESSNVNIKENSYAQEKVNQNYFEENKEKLSSSCASHLS